MLASKLTKKRKKVKTDNKKKEDSNISFITFLNMQDADDSSSWLLIAERLMKHCSHHITL
jgi:hypothetical protein